MQAILDIQGWQKIINIDFSTYRRGELAIEIEPPLSLVAADRGHIPKYDTRKFKFFYEGESSNGMPIFKHT